MYAGKHIIVGRVELALGGKKMSSDLIQDSLFQINFAFRCSSANIYVYVLFLMPLFVVLNWFSCRATGTQQICQGIRGIDVHFSGAGLSALLWLFLEEEGR